MKRTGIITFHFAQNVGAVLQCLALCEQLKKMDVEPFVINYRPKYHVAKYAPWRPAFYLAFERAKSLKNNGAKFKVILTGSIKTLLSMMRENRHYSIHKMRTERFENFTSKFLNQSDIYKTIDQLKKNPPKADSYICGSDQIWNKALMNNSYDLAYFLKFGNSDMTRLAYAPSMGETDLLKDGRAFLDNINNLDGVYFREAVDSEKLSELTGKDFTSVDDPTLFLTMQDYEKFESDISNQEPYIFVYTVLRSPLIQNVITKFSKEKGLRVIDGSTHHYLNGNNIKYDPLCAPGDFLSYIRNAEYVVTNSFHGTVFSILYHKKFITVANKKRNSRIEELLNSLGLQDRLIYDDEYSHIDLESIDYDSVEEKLELKRKSNTDILLKYVK